MDKIFTMDVEKNINAALDFARLLARYKIKGEFYITGKMLEKYPKQIKQISKLSSRHIICAHGYAHEDFSMFSYTEAEQAIKKTIVLFKKNRLKLQGWRFPGFKFRNSHLRILAKYRLFDSSIRDKAVQGWGKFMHIRNFLSHLKRGRAFFPAMFPRNLDERPWSIVDLNDSSLYLKQGRLVFHCYYYRKVRQGLRQYLKTII